MLSLRLYCRSPKTLLCVSSNSLHNKNKKFMKNMVLANIEKGMKRPYQHHGNIKVPRSRECLITSSTRNFKSSPPSASSPRNVDRRHHLGRSPSTTGSILVTPSSTTSSATCKKFSCMTGFIGATRLNRQVLRKSLFAP